MMTLEELKPHLRQPTPEKLKELSEQLSLRVLDNLFTQQLLVDCDNCEKFPDGSRPARVARDMIKKYGGVETARRLVQRLDPQPAFYMLIKQGDEGKTITVENRILEFAPLFNQYKRDEVFAISLLSG